MPKLQLSAAITNKAAAATAMVCGLLMMGAIVTVEPPERLNGHDVYPISLNLAEVQNAAGIQFDIQMDPALDLTEVVAGPAADGAGKTVVFTRLDEDTLRVMVVGLNQNIIGDGVVAYLRAAPHESVTDPFEVGATVISDQVGNPIEWSEGDQPASDESKPATDTGSGNEHSPGPALDVSADSKSVTAPVAGLMPALLDAVVGDYAQSAAPEETQADAKTADQQSHAVTSCRADAEYTGQAGKPAPAGYLHSQAPAQPGRTTPKRGLSYRACSGGVATNDGYEAQGKPALVAQASDASKPIASASENGALISINKPVRVAAPSLKDEATGNGEARTRTALLALAAALPALAAALWTLKAPLSVLITKTAIAATPPHKA